MRRSAHALTLLSICSSLVYLSFYNRSILRNFFENGSADDVEFRGLIESTEYDGMKSREWSYLRRQDTPETSLKRLAGGLIDTLPEPFSLKYKNPCWDVRKKPRQCLPFFYLIGMPKCGTTDVWNKLIEHPHVVNISKEPHWWSRVRIEKLNRTTSKLTADPRTYYTRFATALNRYAASHDINTSKLVIGDGSASTMWDNNYWKMFYPDLTQGPPHVNGELIISIQPNARAIAILRDPSDRLYSDYLYFTKNNTTKLSPQDFHERVKTAIARFRECAARLDVRTCTYSTSSIRKCARIEVGLYSIFINDWLSFFPRRRLKVVTMEDWHRNCLKTLIELYKFLELENMSISDVYRICRHDVQNTRPSDMQQLGPMLTETKTILDNFYAPFNKKLASLLGSDTFLWRHDGSEE